MRLTPQRENLVAAGRGTIQAIGPENELGLSIITQSVISKMHPYALERMRLKAFFDLELGKGKARGLEVQALQSESEPTEIHRLTDI